MLKASIREVTYKISYIIRIKATKRYKMIQIEFCRFNLTENVFESLLLKKTYSISNLNFSCIMYMLQIVFL